MGEKYSDRIEQFLYSRTTEKQIVTELLAGLLNGRALECLLDVGPGPGLITEPLYRAAKQLVLIESDAAYQSVLKEKFPKATLHIGSFLDYDFKNQFDLVLLSHVLYYVGEDRWFSVFQKLASWMKKSGEIFCVMNTDKGVWWDILKTFRTDLKLHWRFYYQPWSEFKMKLNSIGKVESRPYQYCLSFDNDEMAAQAIGRLVLQIYDEKILKKFHPSFLSFVKENFSKQGSHLVTLFDAEMTIFTPS